MNNILKIHIRLSQMLLVILFACNLAQGQQPVKNPALGKVLLTDYCNDLYLSVTPGSDNQGCYFDVEYKHTWSAINCNVLTLPHGLSVDFTNATITSATTLSGAWITGATQHLGPPFSKIYWNKQPLGNCVTPVNAVTSGQLQKKRVRVNVTGSPVTVIVQELDGDSWPADASKYTCTQTFSFSQPDAGYFIGSDLDVCKGQALTLSVNPAPPPGAVVEWYAGNANCTSWGIPFVGGQSFNTNSITSSRCYKAVIKQGCWTYTTNFKRVTVCPGVPTASITTSGGLQMFDGMLSACNSWNGTLILNPDLNAFPCNTTFQWEQLIGSNWTPIPNSTNKDTISSFLLATGCRTIHRFRVRMRNACGEGITELAIAIYSNPSGGSITTLTNLPVDIGTGTTSAPVVCEETRLVHTTTCGKILGWEYRDELTQCSNNYPASWTAVPGAGISPTWWTNSLSKSRQYRVQVGNGPCAAVYSNLITVKVKPKLAVNITATGTILCPGKPVLTATTSYGPPCNYPVSYQWYLNGSPIPGATFPTYSPGQPGKYYVIATDPWCYNKKAKSKVVTICKPELVITAPCCICPGEQITLSAVIKNTCNNAVTYQWNTGSTTAGIAVNTAGTYTVTVTLGGCTFTKSVAISKCP